MNHDSSSNLAEIAAMYDRQASEYADFKERSFSWQYIEEPAFRRLLSGGEDLGLPNLYHPAVRVLDLCCGAGLLVQHLIDNDIYPEQITGVDISGNLIAKARAAIEGPTFLTVSADNFELPSSSIDLVVSNMGLHLLDNEQLARCLELVYDVLTPNGTICFVDADPDYNATTRDQDNANKWLYLPTPWGGTAPWFSRNPHELFLDYFYFAGFDVSMGGPLTLATFEMYNKTYANSYAATVAVAAEGVRSDPPSAERYSSYPARICARLEKVPMLEKLQRLAARGGSTPPLVS